MSFSYNSYSIAHTLNLAYLRRLKLKNIRGFRSLSLDFGADKPRMRTVIVGRNGTCKTTLLRAIALGCIEDASVQSFLGSQFGSLMASGVSEGSIDLEFLWADGSKDNFRRERWLQRSPSGLDSAIQFPSLGSDIKDLPKTLNPVVTWGYGIGRRDTEGDAGGTYRVSQSVKTLFDYDERLVDSELVLRRLESALGDTAYRAVLDGLKRALGLDPEQFDIVVLPQGGIQVRGPGQGGDLKIDSWADGYRMTFYWLVDFYGWALRAGAFDEDGQPQGILLIDELEQHLHPSMQREILDHLSETLPKVQLIVTTHSPLVALSARPDELVSLQRREDQDDEIIAVPVPDLSGFSVEDILVEEALFGTEPYSPATLRRQQRHDELARIPRPDRTPEQQDELRRLTLQLSPADATALRDDPVLEKLAEIKTMLAASTGRKE